MKEKTQMEVGLGEAIMRHNRPADRGSLDELWTGAEDGEEFHATNALPIFS